MAYYTRILSKSESDIDLSIIENYVRKNGLIARLELDPNETTEDWTIFDVFNSNGEPIIQIERNFVIQGELGFEELEELRQEIQSCKPTSAVNWLSDYFKEVKIIYAFQMLEGCFSDTNFPIVNCIKECIWNYAGGIFQADNEGFSNEDGYHILWQFSDDVSGKWNMAIQDSFDVWTNFTMDLGDKSQRTEFMSGKIPNKARRI